MKANTTNWLMFCLAFGVFSFLMGILFVNQYGTITVKHDYSGIDFPKKDHIDHQYGRHSIFFTLDGGRYLMRTEGDKMISITKVD